MPFYKVISVDKWGNTGKQKTKRVFKKYDRLNESIEENVRGMRVVKGFSREEYEKEKFEKTSDEIRKDFTQAERIVALNTPIMQLCLYFIMIFVLVVGSRLSIVSKRSCGKESYLVIRKYIV